MRKTWKYLSTLGLVTVATMGLVACSGIAQGESEEKDVLKVGMVTDAGTIDDKSFNQGTWEGIKRFVSEHEGVEAQYVKPDNASTESFLTAIDHLVLSGSNVIVTPGYSFEEAIGQAQQTHPQVKFVLIDGQPLVGRDDEEQGVYQIADNTVSISFSEHEAGFLAGVASALESKTGKLAYLGGVQVPAVQKLGWGFVAGVAYANQMLGTNAQLVDYIYQGTFTETEAGRTIAGGFYDKGVDIIFAAAGAVGVGAISEAKTRAEGGESVYIVGVDVDQYDEGLIQDGSSIILTSAMKRMDQAAYDMINQVVKGEFPGGEAISMDASLNGVGLPTENPNLSAETIQTVQTVFKRIQSGEIQVPASVEALEAYLEEQQYTGPTLSY